MRIALVALLLCTSCAMARVRTSDGTTVQGIAIGHASVDVYAPAEAPVCSEPTKRIRVRGGALSTSFTETLTLLGTAALAYFAGPAAVK